MTQTTPPKYPHASDQGLDTIEANECNGDGSLATRRFEACFNEIYRLREIIRTRHYGAINE